MTKERQQMLRRKLFRAGFMLALVCAWLTPLGEQVVLAHGQATGAVQSAQDNAAAVSGTIIHILETPADVAGNPSVASINNRGMACAVSFGNSMGGLENFSMVVYSEEVNATQIIGRMAVQWGKARSITIENGDVIESTFYDYVVIVRDDSEAGGEDAWSMTLWGADLMFDGVTFSGPVATGDLVVQP